MIYIIRRFFKKFEFGLSILIEIESPELNSKFDLVPNEIRNRNRETIKLVRHLILETESWTPNQIYPFL